jgi:serine protease Do
MMTKEEMVELYCLDLLEPSDKIAFEKEINNDVQLQKMIAQHKAFIRLVNHKNNKEAIQTQLSIIKKEQSNTVQKINTSLRIHVNKYWKTAGVAAGIAAIASCLTYYSVSTSFENKINEHNKIFTKLSNAVGTNADALKGLNDKVNENNMPEQPKGNWKEMGTGFVVNTNGYILTNAHVVENGKDIYVYDKQNIARKTTVVKIDRALDIALLKLQDDNYKFGNGKLPYSIMTDEKELAEKVYTIGYPKTSKVYNEGYISSQTDYNNNDTYYQLELPISNGASGSPLLDNSGRVIGLLNSKEKTGNVSFALKGSAIKTFLKDVDSVSVPMNGKGISGSKAAQIKSMDEFVVMVRVY